MLVLCLFYILTQTLDKIMETNEIYPNAGI